MLLQLYILKESENLIFLIVGDAIIEIRQLNIYYLNVKNGESRDRNSI